MERVNDILKRTAQSRQEIQEQRSSQQGASPQGLRPGRALTRRAPLPEQTARLGQQNSLASTQRPMPQELPAGTGNHSEETKYPQHRLSDQALHQRDIDRRSPVYYQRAYHSIQEPEHFVSEQEERKITSDYYDAYPVIPPADVQEDWEDDAEGMRYGDWETEASQDIHHYSPTDRGVTFIATVEPQDASWPHVRELPKQQVSPSRKTRDLSNTSAREREPRSPLTRSLRDKRISQAQPPVHQASPQETQGQHRNTQPLNPRAIAGVKQRIPQEGPRAPEPMSKFVVYEHPREDLSVIPPSSIAPKGICPKCKGAGYLRIDAPFGHPNFGKPVACECKEAEKKEKRRQQLLELSDLSAFQNRSFKNFSTRFPGIHPSVQEAFQEAYRFAQDPSGWLVLIGPNGCGKTHLAAAIANQNLSYGSVVLFAVVPDLLAHLRATFAPTSTEAYDQRFYKMREAELLVLDDLGAHQSSPWANEKLFQLLNYRYNSGYPTVITANRQGLASVDERILSRLSDTALVTTVVLNGALDYRRQIPRREPLR